MANVDFEACGMSASSQCTHGEMLDHGMTVLVVKDEMKPGIKGLTPVHVKLFFFSFVHQGKIYPSQCALVEWFKKYGAYPDKETGMWRVRPHMVGHHQLTTVIHLDSVL